MNDIELGWLAGIIDGEGNLSIKHHKNHTKKFGERLGFYAELTVVNTNEEIVRRCQEITGIGKVFFRDKKQPSKRLWCWRIYSTGLRQLLPKLLPHLAKRKEAEILMRAMDITGTRHGMKDYWGGQFRTNDEIIELFKLRDNLIDLHGLSARKLATVISPEPYLYYPAFGGLSPQEVTDIK